MDIDDLIWIRFHDHWRNSHKKSRQNDKLYGTFFQLRNDKDIKASIDLDGKKEGSYEVPVEIVLPDGYETVEDVTTEVVISSGTAVDDSKENKE